MPDMQANYHRPDWWEVSELQEACRCTRACDCQDEPNGLCSNECPEHNFYPRPHPQCEAAQHWWGGSDLEAMKAAIGGGQVMHDFEQLPIRTRTTRPTIPANTGVVHRADPGVPNGAACGAEDAVTSTRGEMVTCPKCVGMFKRHKANKESQ